MEYEDRITIWAPEGLALDYTLAGLGSRFLADLVDVGIRVIVLGAVLAILEAAGAPSTVVLIVFVVGAFLALFAYDIAFEVWAAGRTPGKRWNGLRVLMANGQPVTFSASAVRNLMRVIDIWATAMVAGSVSIIVTPRNQRLGDLAGGTIVVRERRAGAIRFGRTAQSSSLSPAASSADPSSAGPPTAGPAIAGPAIAGPAIAGPAIAGPPIAGPPTERPAVPAGLDVTAITASELSAVRDFLSRRDRLSREARARVADTLAATLSAKVGGLPPGRMSPERLLETIAAAKAASGYGSASRS
jgi:uncharacterized RDD family membrane protein YckC